MTPATYKFLADALVVFHFAFVAFVMTGAIAVLRWRRVAWLHIPAVMWGIFIETSHGICPLTPLENQWRRLAGESAYEGGFVDHYIMPVLYPRGLTDEAQLAIAAVILLINGVCYGILIGKFVRARSRKREAESAKA